MNPPNKRDVKRNYDELGGKLYDLRYREEQDRKYDAAFLVTLPRRDDILLDDGCGTGMFFSRFDAPTVGLDLTPNLLRTARENLKVDHHLVMGDAERIPIRDGVFDYVYSITLIQNTPNKRMVASEMKRVTRIHGRVLVTALKAVFNQGFLEDLLEEVGFDKISSVGDADTNDWIASGENEAQHKKVEVC